MAATSLRVIAGKGSRFKEKYGDVHFDVEIGEAERRTLAQLVEWEGLVKVSEAVGVSAVTLAKVCAGWTFSLRPESLRKVKAFFGGRR